MRGDRPSDTAVLIGRCTLLAARDPDRHALVPRGAIEPLARLLAGDDTWFARALPHAWVRGALGAVEQLALPGIITHYLARKRWLEALTRQALQRGASQVVVVGAGFDTLAWRLHRELPAVQFFELDHPATQDPKRRRLEAAANLTYLPVDLSRESPAAVLRSCPTFSTDKRTLFVAEGLLMYFPESEVVALLHGLARVTRPPAEMVFSFMARAANGSIGFQDEHAAIGWWLRRANESFRWGAARDALPALLQRCGLQVLTIADHETLRTEILAPLGRDRLPLARGECLCHCLATSSVGHF
jgi:methyltransferase (TIGR00027 family)